MKRDYRKEHNVYCALIEAGLDSTKGWDEDWDSSETILEAIPIDVGFYTKLGTMTKVAQELSHDFNNEYNHVWMVFRLDGEHFRITGVKSSYGTSCWNNGVDQVSMKEEMRVFYE